VISWFLILTTSIILIYSTGVFYDPEARNLLLQNSLPLWFQFTILYLGLAISLISGIAFLKRQNWARFLYSGWCVIGFIIGFATSPVRMVILPEFVLFLVEAYFLFRPKANVYFLSKQDLANKEIEIVHMMPTKRRWLSVFRIVFYIGSVVFIGTGTMMSFLNDVEAIAIVIIFSISGFILMLVGLAFNRFLQWKKESGLVLISAAAYASFVIVTVRIASLSPEFRKSFNMPADVFIFNDYLSGLSFIILFAVAGFVMLKLQKFN
jgi:hypothetical protein